MAGKRPLTARQNRRLARSGTEKALAQHPCGECTECCTTMSVVEIGKDADVRCSKLLDPKTSDRTGCSVYRDRPGSCEAFNCVYRVGLFDTTKSVTGILGRPDHLGLLFDVQDTRAPGIQMLVVREIRPGCLDAEMGLLHELAAKGYVLYLVDGDRRRMMGPEERVRAVQLAAKRALPIISPGRY